MKKIIGKLYPCKVLRDAATGKPLMLPHTKDSDRMRRAGQKAAQDTLRRLQGEII